MDNLMFEDKSGQQELFNIQQGTNSDTDDVSDSDEELVEEIKPIKPNLSSCWDDITTTTSKKKNEVSKEKLGYKLPGKDDDEIDINDVYVDLGWYNSEIDNSVRKIADQDELMKNSVIVPEFHRLHEIPTENVSRRKARKLKKEEKEKTAGSSWFNMPKPEMTKELSRDVEVIKMRSVLDPKQFYKKNTMKTDMKYFQVGRIVESSADYYHSRITKKERKKTLVDELLANTEFKKYNKRRYKEIISKSIRYDGKARKHANKLKKKKK